MLTIRSISTSVLTALFAVSPTVALAAEGSSSLLPPIWPLIALFVIVVVFRKQLNCNPSFEQQDTPPPAAEPASIKNPPQTLPEQLSQPELVPTENNSEQVPPEPKNIEAEVKAAKNTIIDLKEDGKRCQASTTKGTRCKRKTTLEDSSVTISDITYLLTVCKQHSISNFKPFAELIK